MDKILLIEDNPHIMNINKFALAMLGYEVLTADSIIGAQQVLSIAYPDVIVLDIMLPDGDGVEWCKKYKANHDTPILFLSALGNAEEVVKGLRSGGDDYLAKPYEISVLIARIQNLLKRKTASDRYIDFQGLRLDSFSQIAFYNGQDLLLTQKEYSVLRLLIIYSKMNKTITREELYSFVWAGPKGEDSRAVWTTISRLKSKLKQANSDVLIESNQRDGYYLVNGG